MALPPLPDFFYKFGKGLCAGQVQCSARLAAVPVPAGDDGALPALGEFHDAVIFFRASRGVEFKSVEEFDGQSQELVKDLVVLARTGARLVPKWMVEYDEHIGNLIEHGQEFADPLVRRIPAERVEFGHDGLRAAGRQIMNANVKD